ncbi:MAG: DSD1 family PLP-dependent enzyme [Myxococcales bacterium FL481]|nr:MAG: DSD1 family PLP-dependent enzyme [Myxococcales bacterium FL481]
MHPNSLAQINTPALVVDVAKVTSNVERMAARLRQHQVGLRPHVKTAKCEAAAALMTQGQSGGIAVSTVAEAEFFFALGYRDITYAVGIAAGKLARLAELVARGARVAVLIDHADQVDMVGRAAVAAGIGLDVLIEIDCDGRRAGLSPTSSELVRVASAVSQRVGARLAGVLTHAGGSYACATTPDIVAMARRECEAAVEAATRLRAAGLAVSTVSVGSTPTALFGDAYAGVTEVRAGVYVFFDLVMANLGVCRIEDIALSVLCTVIGHQRDRNWLITDAGWTALSRDRGTREQPVDYGYGLVCDLRGEVVDDDLVVLSTSQEHGIVGPRSGAQLDLARFPIGSHLRVLPNHACATAAAHDGYHVVDGVDLRVTAYWERCRGW